MRTTLRIAGQALIALTFLAACGSSPSTVAKATPSSSPASASILDDHFGFLAGDGVRSESDARPLFVLGIGEVSGVVSPDGRRLAYWAASELRVIQIAPNQKPHTVLTVTTPEGALYFAWSSDGTGLAVGVNAPVANPAPDGPPAYTAIRTVDVAGGQPREVARVSGANVVPLAWDRQARLIAAYEPSSSGGRSYFVIEEGGKVSRNDAGPGLYIVEANSEGRDGFGHRDPANNVPGWPRGSYASGVQIRGAGGERILGVRGRPGSSEGRGVL